MMFTATWPREVRTLAEEFLRNPAHVQIGNSDALQAAPTPYQVRLYPDQAA